MPLSHAPGHAQCGFGEALVIIGGVEHKAHYLILDLPHSDGCFVKAYPAAQEDCKVKISRNRLNQDKRVCYKSPLPSGEG